MQNLLRLIFIVVCFISCKTVSTVKTDNSAASQTRLTLMLEKYYEERLQFAPLEATIIGDNRYNHLLTLDFTESYRDSLKSFYTKYLNEVSSFNYNDLNETDKISYAIFKREMEINIEAFTFHDNYIPFNQFYGLPLTMGILGSGTGFHPFKTEKDYQDWMSRVDHFATWSDSAIVYFNKGINANIVLPEALVAKMIPQLRAMHTEDVTQSLFYSPITQIPENFSAESKEKLKEAYIKMIKEKLLPSYNKLADYLEKDYLHHARNTSGISSLPNGKEFYKYLVRYSTTTNKTPEEIYQTGLQEVSRIREIMDSIRKAVNFDGDLKSFFNYMRNDKKFMPYKTPENVLAAFEDIHQRMQPHLTSMFKIVPKSTFEIRQTEAFRAESASAEYSIGSPDGSRPGIFYVPIIDATAFNITSGMESLFLHEAIPGHHYQLSLQQENLSLPKFRRYGGNNAYIEGWALYCESLGKELGLYVDPYQYMGALGDEIHRAIRLVVDVAIHTKGMSREEAIKYMMDNEAINEQGATAEIERYMAIPSQALGYKIGALKIQELRNKYTMQLGNNFNLSDFHYQVLKDGAMPLEILEKKMDIWANSLMKN